MGLKIWPFLLIIVIASCKELASPYERIKARLKLDSSASLRKDIPEYYNDSKPILHVLRKERSRIGLPSIENGSEVFQIRIREELKNEAMVLVFKHEDNVWNAKGYFYYFVSIDGSDVDSLSVNIISLGEPKSGWNEFLNKLLDNNILELRDDSKIDGYFEATDLLITDVEIASKDYYRYYLLSGVYLQPSSIKDAKSMIEILALIRKEFPVIGTTLSDSHGYF